MKRPGRKSFSWRARCYFIGNYLGEELWVGRARSPLSVAGRRGEENLRLIYRRINSRSLIMHSSRREALSEQIAAKGERGYFPPRLPPCWFSYFLGSIQRRRRRHSSEDVTLSQIVRVYARPGPETFHKKLPSHFCLTLFIFLDSSFAAFFFIPSSNFCVEVLVGDTRSKKGLFPAERCKYYS